MRQYNREEASFIQERAAERIAEVLDALGVDYVERSSYLQGACPVHGGDNPRAWYWATNTYHWRCATKHCEKEAETGPSSSVFGLVRGVMSRKDGKPWSYQMAVDFVARALHLGDTKLDPGTEEDGALDRAIKEYRKRQKDKPAGTGTPLATMLPLLKPDALYFPSRGITPETITRYHISVCDDPQRPFFHRAFFPILDVTGRYVQGWSGRSMWPQCSKCKHHHDPAWGQCPPREDFGKYAKWRHSASFHAERCLYNIWYARPHIGRSTVAILVEGPGDVWAFEQAGIRNSVAMFGLSLSQHQRQMLQSAGAMTLLLAIDNDEASMKAKTKLMEELNWFFRVYDVTPQAKDFGAMQPEEINGQIGPLLAKVSKAAMLKDEKEGEAT